VPQLPPTAITASPEAATARFRAWPIPVTTTWSIHSLASSRRSPGRIPIVVPPALFAPRAAAAMTSPRPPVTTVQPPSAIMRPLSRACASCPPPLPITATWIATGAMLIGMDAQARGGTLVLGGGFAGSYVAKLLKEQGATIVSPENFMLFASMLPEAASGTLEPRHVVVPLRLMCPHADLVLGRAVAHDPDRRRVQVETEEGLANLTYQNLVVALGAIPRVLPIPGLADYAFGFKDLADAIALRNHILLRLEAAAAAPTEAHRRRELTFVFVGAGYAGVEALAALSDLARDALRYYPDEIRATPQHWVLVDAAPKILPEIPTDLGQYAAGQLERRGVDIRVGTTLESVGPHEAVLSDGDRI